MKQTIIMILTALMLLSFIGCDGEKKSETKVPPAATTEPLPTTELERTLGNFQLLMVNDVLYYNTQSHTTASYGYPDDYIATSRYPGNVPYKNNQSNFGSGYEYYFDYDGLRVCIDGTWWLFHPVNYPLNIWGLELQVENASPTGCEVVCNRGPSDVTEEITVGALIELQQWTEKGWKTADGLIHIMDMDWGSERWSIETGGQLRWTVDWSAYFKELEPGSYRLGKLFKYISADGVEHYDYVYDRFEIEG